MQVSLGSDLFCWQVAIINGYRGCPIISIHQPAIIAVHRNTKPKILLLNNR